MNAFTVDLEDWFCSHNLQGVIKYEDWDKLESRVVRNTQLLLDLLDEHQVKATFFTLGWIAERYPELIQKVFDNGHDIQCHGYSHQRLMNMDPGSFENDIQKATTVLKDITGVSPVGYRAPAFSITAHTRWALPILRQYGFQYDSSIYPVRWHPDYGDISVPHHIHKLEEGLVEVPLNSTRIGKLQVPCSGGAYLRFIPFSVFHRLVQRVVNEESHYVFYIHPWELDTNPVKVRLPYTKHLRHFYNTSSTYKKINSLLSMFPFGTMDQLIKSSACRLVQEAI